MKTKSDGSPASNKYKKPVGDRTHIDVYDVCDIFAVEDHSGAIQHAIKKLLCNGERGYKPAIQDYREAIGSIQRKIELMQALESFGQQNTLEFPPEDRIDAIGQNGNDGEHYQEQAPSWDNAPEWAMWLAQDNGGAWYWFQNEPYQADDVRWLEGSEHGKISFCVIGSPSHNWRNTLQKRPE